MISKEELINTAPFTEDQSLSCCYREKQALITKIMNSNSSERTFLIFKLFFDSQNIETINLINQVISKHPITFFNVCPLIEKAMRARSHRLDTINNREIVTKVMSKYRSLLSKMLCLSKELNLDNSLELSILFSYLLWKGYLSKTKENIYTSENRKMLTGLYFADIMEGVGVCLNHSEMLKDFLNTCGYSSVMLINNCSSGAKMTQVIDIERKQSENTQNDTSLILSLLEMTRRNKINHVFNLIEENEKLYIYDATNLSLLRIDSPYSASIINGSGKVKLFPFQSYEFCLSKDDCTFMDKILTEKIFPFPYTKEDFISISKVALEIMKNSHYLFEDFYTEARPDIIGISEETDKIKALTKTK